MLIQCPCCNEEGLSLGSDVPKNDSIPNINVFSEVIYPIIEVIKTMQEKQSKSDTIQLKVYVSLLDWLINRIFQKLNCKIRAIWTWMGGQMFHRTDHRWIPGLPIADQVSKETIRTWYQGILVFLSLLLWFLVIISPFQIWRLLMTLTFYPRNTMFTPPIYLWS